MANQSLYINEVNVQKRGKLKTLPTYNFTILDKDALMASSRGGQINHHTKVEKMFTKDKPKNFTRLQF